MAKSIASEQVEQLAKEIRQFLLDNGLWIDVRIYFSGKAFSTDDDCGHYCYNDPDNLIVLEDIDPKDYFEYAGPYLSMSFEGPVYEILNCGGAENIEEEFSSIFTKYGLYYELGNAWNLTAYPD